MALCSSCVQVHVIPHCIVLSLQGFRAGSHLWPSVRVYVPTSSVHENVH